MPEQTADESRGRSLKSDTIIIGAGIVGLSTAWQLKQLQPESRILLLDKEFSPARHQSGHNSGVIHAGVYYEPGSLKAEFCRQGLQATYAFCREHGVPCRNTGKLVVATNPAEFQKLKDLLERCRANGLDPAFLDGAGLRDLEPRIRGEGALLVEESGIVDFPGMCKVLLAQFRHMGGLARLGMRVTAISEEASRIFVHAGADRFEARQLVVCAGLMADRLARMQGLDTRFRIIPYRGEYYRLRENLSGLVRHLVYPVPDPQLPFLGIHLTPMITGHITVGPNAVQGWKREGYGRLNFSLQDTLSMLAYPGYWRVTSRHLRHGLTETWNSLWKPSYVAQVRKYCPEINASDLVRYPAGIRAQAVQPDGSMLHDFLIEKTARSLHVCNAPSPAATSAIPIGRHICKLLVENQLKAP